MDSVTAIGAGFAVEEGVFPRLAAAARTRRPNGNLVDAERSKAGSGNTPQLFYQKYGKQRIVVDYLCE